MSELAPFINKEIQVLTSDGRIILGTLKGFDQTTNLILANAKERVFSQDAGVEEIALGLYLMRGDSISVVGNLDVELDQDIDWASLAAAPIAPIKITAI